MRLRVRLALSIYSKRTVFLVRVPLIASHYSVFKERPDWQAVRPPFLARLLNIALVSLPASRIRLNIDLFFWRRSGGDSTAVRRSKGAYRIPHSGSVKADRAFLGTFSRPWRRSTDELHGIAVGQRVYWWSHTGRCALSFLERQQRDTSSSQSRRHPRRFGLASRGIHDRRAPPDPT